MTQFMLLERSYTKYWNSDTNKYHKLNIADRIIPVDKITSICKDYDESKDFKFQVIIEGSKVYYIEPKYDDETIQELFQRMQLPQPSLTKSDV